MVDLETLTYSLEQRGHRVERTISVPENAGGVELVVDGRLLTLEEARMLLVDEEPS